MKVTDDPRTDTLTVVLKEGTPVAVRVDLVTAEELSPFIGPRILAELEDVSLAG